ncbi:hypothetical protein P691DRAFT_142419 [Macrolepiota fuliginosa MF-IS2]|uniref:Uncharacterized protein n=1 Tax=Macrolepiota fuliginosa MF-IS2 TaxID=1400762 RepID=A0A9P6C3A0_9AGAR|nr:hypothetical protein P691DRAFT_142419 [Macrolepiota fuliginosa MF-IS2]
MLPPSPCHLFLEYIALRLGVRAVLLPLCSVDRGCSLVLGSCFSAFGSSVSRSGHFLMLAFGFSSPTSFLTHSCELL